MSAETIPICFIEKIPINKLIPKSAKSFSFLSSEITLSVFLSV